MSDEKTVRIAKPPGASPGEYIAIDPVPAGCVRFVVAPWPTTPRITPCRLGALLEKKPVVIDLAQSSGFRLLEQAVRRLDEMGIAPGRAADVFAVAPTMLELLRKTAAVRYVEDVALDEIIDLVALVDKHRRPA